MKRVALILFMTLTCLAGLAQKTKTVSATYTYTAPATMSIEEAKRVAQERAQIQAIADEFGTVVTQTNSSVITNDNGVTNTNFTTIGGSEVKGEWIEELEQPKYEILTDGSELAIKVTVKGKIREIVRNNKVTYNLKVLRNGVTDADEADRFMNDDDLYIAFSSPVSGFLAIYLIDCENNAFCLLPYQGQEDGIFKTKANHKYIFFHPDHAYGLPKELVEEMVVTTERQQEQNRIVTIFSDNKFYKGSDSSKGSQLPRSMSADDFLKWLSSVRKADPNLLVTEKPITIIAKYNSSLKN